MNISNVLLVIAVVITVTIVMRMMKGGTEHYRQYFGMGPPLDAQIRSFPFCGSEVSMYIEDANYPFLVNTTVQEYNNEKDTLISQLETSKKESTDIAGIAGYNLLSDNVVVPNDNSNELMARELEGYNKKQQDTSFGLDKAEVENFDQAPNPMTWSNAGRLVYDHPDSDDFNQMYYSNPSRTIGMADQRQAVIHFNEAAAYYGNVQQQIPESADASNWNYQNVPVSNASEFFDIVDKYSKLVDDPRVPVDTYTYSTNGNSFKKRQNFNDIVDNINRKRNQTIADQYNRGTSVTNKAREIMNTVFAPDLERMEALPWWELQEP